MKIQFNCADCKKLLGVYKGEQFWLTSCPDAVETLCEICYKKMILKMEPNEKSHNRVTHKQ